MDRISPSVSQQICPSAVAEVQLVDCGRRIHSVVLLALIAEKSKKSASANVKIAINPVAVTASAAISAATMVASAISVVVMVPSAMTVVVTAPVANFAVVTAASCTSAVAMERSA